MRDKPILILLVEDNPDDADLLEKYLAEAEQPQFTLITVGRMTAALERLAEEKIDLILLDLGLPDSQGGETLAHIQNEAPDIPIIILTGMNDEAAAIQAVQQGVQDYLVKDEINSRTLRRSLRYAIERYHLQTLVADAQSRERQENEKQLFEPLARPPGTTQTARLFGGAPLRETAPDIYANLVESYANLLDLALEQRALRVEHNITEQLRLLSQQLGTLRAGPRDVIAIHLKAVDRKTEEVSVQKAQAYIEEGRIMVLELMGHLVSFYRAYTFGLSGIPPQQRSKAHG